MGIPDEDIARVRAATDIVALVSEQSALKRQGRRWVGLCPFHTEKSGSFSVNAEEGFYYCFGCHAKGDAITFVRETQHLDFADAVRLLADRAGIAIRDDGKGGEDASQRKRLREVMARAAEWYHERLISGADGGEARAYLRSRGYGRDVVERFRLGWAPDAWDALVRDLGIGAELADSSGLGFTNKAGRLQDAFRARVMFPIFDTSGQAVAFGGRVLPGSSDPAKYKNSKETTLYSKRRVLYGLNWAKDEVIRSGEVIVCEGYTDVIGYHEAGVHRAVATCGTALAEEHFRLLANFAKRVVLSFDADNAGQSAAERVYEWERRHQLDVAVAELPGGADPAEVARDDPGALLEAVESAKPFLRFRVDRVMAATDRSTPEGRARAAQRALAVIREHPDALVRDQYVMDVAEVCRLEPQSLRQRLAEGPGEEERDAHRPATGSEGPRAAVRGASGSEVSENRAELEALRLCLQRPGEMGPLLIPQLFSPGATRAAFEALLAADDLHQAIETAPPDVGGLLGRLVVEETVAEPDDVRTLLLRAASRRRLGALAAAVRRGEVGADRAAELTAEARRALEELDAGGDPTPAVDRLLAFLRGRGES